MSIDKKIFEPERTETIKAEIKQITHESWETISQIQENDGFDHADYLSKERFERLLERGEIFYGAFSEGKPAGFAALDLEKRAQIHFFSILKEYQNSGISYELMNYLLEQCKNKKYEKVIVAIEERGIDVKKFFEKIGFREVGFFKDRYGEGRNALFFSKDL